MTDPVHSVLLSLPNQVASPVKTYFWLHLVKIAGNIICRPPDDTIKTWDEYCLGSHAKKLAIETNSCSSDYMLQHVGLTKRLHSPFVISQLKAFLVLKSSIEYVSGKMRIWLNPIPPSIFMSILILANVHVEKSLATVRFSLYPSCCPSTTFASWTACKTCSSEIQNFQNFSRAVDEHHKKLQSTIKIFNLPRDQTDGVSLHWMISL